MSRPDYIAEVIGVRGTVQWYKADKGYGFIRPDDGDKDVFMHAKHINFDPQPGDRVFFSIAEDRRRNRTYAVEVVLEG